MMRGFLLACLTLISSVTFSVSCHAIEPVAYFSFDEGKGESAGDTAGGIKGSVSGAEWVKTGKGWALNFDGLSSKVEIGREIGDVLTGDSTFMAWIRLSAPVIPDFSTNWTVFSSETFPTAGCVLRIGGDTGKLYYRISSKDGYASIGSEKALENNVFYHVAVVRKGTSVTLFIDGLSDASGEVKLPDPSSQPLTISSSYQSIAGIIDEVKIYDKALTPGEVTSEFRKDADLMGKDTSGFGKIALTPFLYYERERLTAEADLSGMLPLDDGENAFVEMSEMKAGVLDTRNVGDIPVSGKVDFDFDLSDIQPGDYIIHAAVKSAKGEIRSQSSFNFKYPRPAPAVPAPSEQRIAALPRPPVQVPFKVDVSSRGGLSIEFQDEKYPVDSGFSYPDGGFNRLTSGEATGGEPGWRVKTTRKDTNTWVVDASGSFYSIKRTVSVLPGRVQVEDTISNLSEEALGIILSNNINASGRGYASALLGGNKAFKVRGVKLGANPTAFLGKNGQGIGLLAMDDVYIAQGRGSFEEGTAGIASESFALDKGASYTLKWAVYPSGTGDYYDFINQVRNDLKRNGCIDGGMGLNHYAQDGVPAKEYFESRGLKYLCIGGLTHIPDDRGITLDGVDFLEYPKTRAWLKKVIADLKAVYPDLKIMFHIAHSLWATNTPGETLADSCVRNADGSLPLYNVGKWYFSEERLEQGWRWQSCYSTPDNTLGKLLMQSVDVMIDELGCDAVFMDGFGLVYGAEFTYDRWDGHSADIDPETKRIIRKKGDVILLQKESMIEFARKMRDRGGVVIANGTTPVASVLDETYIIHDSEIIPGPHMHLTSTPAALANPENVMDKGDRALRALYDDTLDKLRWANLFFHYGDAATKLTERFITSYFYPLTFQDIRAGCITGKERIVTSNSGVYGWRGNQDLHVVHLSDSRGVMVPCVFTSTSDSAGTRTQLDLRRGEIAVVVRIPVTIRSSSAVNMVTTQYDGDGLSFTANGKGRIEVSVRDGDFRIAPNGTYSVNGKITRADARGVLKFAVTLDGQTNINVRGDRS